MSPYGSWPTPITSELVVAATSAPRTPQFDGERWWWAEVRPDEGGRTAIVCDGGDVLPLPWNARTAAHEYGGGAWWVRQGTLWFVNWSDQRLYRVDPDGDGWADPQPLTAEPATPRADRWADGSLHPIDQSIACVREQHRPDGVVNEIVRLAAHSPGPIEVIVSGPDFVSDPRWSPDGARLCWLEWDHPNMPWDGTRLMVDGRQIAGGDAVSISQPSWQPDGALLFLSDISGWWNLYRWDGAAIAPVAILPADICHPQWVFGERRYVRLADGRVVFAARSGGFDRLCVVGTDGVVHDLGQTPGSYDSLATDGQAVTMIAASPATEESVTRLTLESDRPRIASSETVRPPRHLGLDPAWFSMPQAIDFPSAAGRTAHALYYPPTSPTHEGPPGHRPPLLVTLHGGPTAGVRPMLSLARQYWTSRGFAVVDVDYGGSSGYGRPYRKLLDGAWGVVDVEDCQAAARWLAEQGLVDPHRLCIRGGSAGGYTTLAALAFGTTFSAGASHFGIADLEALARDTHKFESRYLDSLIGPYPEERQRYIDRSPINHIDGFDRPLIVLQGLEDEVVPPAQSEMIVDALSAKGVPVAYVPFEGEQHGFRQAANIRRALDAELSFYGQVLGFELPAAEGIEAVELRR